MNIKLADQMNEECRCQTLDSAALTRELEKSPELSAWLKGVSSSHPHLFAANMVFISEQQRRAMADMVQAVHELVQSPAWQDLILHQADSAHLDPSALWSSKAKGVFLGFDFHLQGDAPQLIEINTNAGGALLNLALAKAQKACCASSESIMQSIFAANEGIESQWLAMFKAEWRLERGDAPIGHIAIVDNAPLQQFLYPEFLLFQKMFEQAGVKASIVDAQDLTWHSGVLWLGSERVDMVYQRSTDFYLQEPAQQALRQAYDAGAIVLTPNPKAHALYADKKNLAALSDAELLKSLGLTSSIQHTLLRSVPRTQIVSPSNAAALWAERKHLFFKPMRGFGSRAAYRGDKITQRVWQDILQGDYVAQTLIKPSQRHIADDESLKFDIRAYAYEGQIQLFAARLYEGQTTNMRTPHGGFSCVYVMPS
jgi:hypothetical protein